MENFSFQHILNIDRRSCQDRFKVIGTGSYMNYNKNHRVPCKQKKNYILLLVSLFCITLCYAQTHTTRSRSYYIDLFGNDKNNGTRNQPWKTIQKVNSIHLMEGDMVIFKSGQTFHGTLRPDTDSGRAAAKPVLITSSGKERAIIDAGNESAIIIENKMGINVRNLKLRGSGRKNGNSGDGIALVNCRYIKLNNLDISCFRNSGVLVQTSSDVKVTNVNAHDNGFAGISVSGEYLHKESCNNVYIGYCTADNNPGSPVILNNHSGNGIVAGFCSKLIIEYCTATNNGWDMPRVGNGPVGIWCYEADSVTIQHCISYRNKTSVGGDDGGGFDLDGGVTNSIIQYCLSYENQGSGFGIFQYAGASPWHHNTMRYNISENDGKVSAARAGIYIWNSSEDSTQFHDCLFYNNTIYNNGGAAVNYAGQSKRSGFSFYNNIFVAGDSLLKGKRSNDIFLANNWWSLKNRFYMEGTKDLPEWAKKSGQEIRNNKLAGLNIDPGFHKIGSPVTGSARSLKLFNRYKILPASVLRNKGLDLQNLYGIEPGGKDFGGQKALPKGIGASF